MRAPGVRVPRGEAEEARRRLLAEGRLDPGLRPAREGAHVLFPVVDGGDGEYEFEAAPDRPRGYQERLALPTELQALLPTAFDVVGHVVIVKLPEPLEPHRDAIAAALLESHPQARTVAIDRGVGGPLRVRRLEVVAGDPSTETVYSESGARFVVDPAKAYFSPRLAFERARVASLVEPGEVVVDLFAGVGPWSVLVAKAGAASKVYAVDLNPQAVRLLERNVEANRVTDVVEPVLADARAFCADHPGLADRVIANLPHDAHRYFEDALRVLKEKGTIHHHAILADGEVGAHVEDLARRARRAGRALSVLNDRVVRAYSPTERHRAIDLAVG